MPLRRFGLLAGALLLGTAAARGAEAPAFSIEVDAREAPRKIFHARLRIPVRPGPLTLLYPQWLPGEHGPTGPIADLAGLHFRAGSGEIAWTRDPVNMYAFHLSIPDRADVLEVSLDFLSPAGGSGFSSGASATEELTIISWNQLLVYPEGTPPDALICGAALKLPPLWEYATALDTTLRSGGDVAFAPVSLTTLVDSPVLAGAHVRTVALSEGPVPHRLRIAADGEAALAITADDAEHYRNLVAETGALFGARHYRHYDFLLTLSDHVAHFGLEHHESSDDRTAERSLIDEDLRREMAGLLPHEMVHSWNGKFRRPAGLEPGRFDQPMKGELLWVYEGLTEYLGQVLTARSGLLTADQYRDSLALTAAGMDAQKGRSWRPLADTAVAAQILFPSRPDWGAWRRGTDFYPESELLWLEADATIRRETKGKRSLDDFCRAFFGGESGPPRVVPYTFADVVAALDRVAPYDWSAFWRTRLERKTPHAPLEGIVAGGWRLSFGSEPTAMARSAEEARKELDARFSIGVLVEDDGTIPDVLPDSPAAAAGVPPGGRLVAVNARRYTRDALRDALKASATRPLELWIEDGEFFRIYRLEYSGGERYPRLERDPSAPDLLSEIVRPLVPRNAATPAAKSGGGKGR